MGRWFRRGPAWDPMWLLAVAILVLALVPGCGSHETANDGEAGSALRDPTEAPAKSPSASAAPKHVVLLTLDTLRADALTPYGGPTSSDVPVGGRPPPPTSPVLHRLAARGVRFDDAIAQAIVTPPSHASILTGLNPPRHGLRRLAGQTLDPAQLTLTEILRDAGFETAAFVSGKPLRVEVGLDQGFDHYDEVAQGMLERDARETNARVFEWLAARTSDEPTFLWVHYFDPHAPYAAPPDYQRRFLGRPLRGEEFMKGRTQNPDTSRMAGDPHPPAAQVDVMRRLYDAEVRYMDDAIGMLLKRLDDAGILDDAIIAIVADHGESLGEHGYYFGHWDALYENARVPMILVHPRGRYAGRVVDATVRTVDLMPTILAWLSLPVPERLDGLDLTALIEGREHAPRYAFTEQVEFFDVHALRGPDWLLLQRSEVAEPGRAMRTRWIERSDGEKSERDAGDLDPELRAAMREQLEATLHPDDAGENVASPVSSETAEQLRALGYLPD